MKKPAACSCACKVAENTISPLWPLHASVISDYLEMGGMDWSIGDFETQYGQFETGGPASTFYGDFWTCAYNVMPISHGETVSVLMAPFVLNVRTINSL